ncbi:unnamed protein product [Owenia fusiformis]|uniref:Centromere protein M n=1 Tax=Owenia fusiformis TaxID=6347 RepID=A0A8J1UKL5_OWEFU|nr:unnamed protein product [Owenia fusiformis]
MSSAISPFSKVPSLNTTTVLIVGTHGVGKHELAKSLLGIPTPYSVQIRTANELPLPPLTGSNERPKIDLVVFMIDLNVRSSIGLVENAVTALDVHYFMGRVCFVVKRESYDSPVAMDTDALISLRDSYNSPMLYGDVKIEQDRISVTRQILNLLEVAAGYKTNISPLLIQATQKGHFILTDS